MPPENKPTTEEVRACNPYLAAELGTLPEGAVVLALGQNVDTSVLKNIPGIEMSWDGVVEVGPNMMTGAEGVFAGGEIDDTGVFAGVLVGDGRGVGSAFRRSHQNPTLASH